MIVSRTGGCALVLALALCGGARAQFTEQQKLAGSDEGAGDRFGGSVSVSGDLAVVGAQLHGAGRAYVLRLHGTQWSEEAHLGPGTGAWFGGHVSVSRDLVNGHDVLASGSVNDEQVEVYRRQDDGSWPTTPEAVLAVPGAGRFGVVAVDGDTIIVGAYLDTNDAGTEAGSAFAFHHDDTMGWTLEQQIVPPEVEPADYFGFSVAVEGNWAVIGAPGDDDLGDLSGSAYLFHRVGTVWQECQKITGSTEVINDTFGVSVAMSGRTIVVGADGRSDPSYPGKAYLFERTGDHVPVLGRTTARPLAGRCRATSSGSRCRSRIRLPSSLRRERTPMPAVRTCTDA
ncbi:MAG: FG-GAP repeat protein [Planctomycetota bacterium]